MELQIEGELLDLQALKYIAIKMGLSCNIKFESQEDTSQNWYLMRDKVSEILTKLCIKDDLTFMLTTLIENQSVIPLIKFIRNYNNIGFGLKESKDYVESFLRR